MHKYVVMLVTMCMTAAWCLTEEDVADIRKIQEANRTALQQAQFQAEQVVRTHISETFQLVLEKKRTIFSNQLQDLLTGRMRVWPNDLMSTPPLGSKSDDWVRADIYLPDDWVVIAIYLIEYGIQVPPDARLEVFQNRILGDLVNLVQNIRTYVNAQYKIPDTVEDVHPYTRHLPTRWYQAVHTKRREVFNELLEWLPYELYQSRNHWIGQSDTTDTAKYGIDDQNKTWSVEGWLRFNGIQVPEVASVSQDTGKRWWPWSRSKASDKSDKPAWSSRLANLFSRSKPKT